MKALSIRFVLALVPILVGLAFMAGPRPASAHVFSLTIDPEGTASHPGGVQVGVSGTLRCEAGETGFLNVSATQLVRGQVVSSAFGSAGPFQCNGVTQNWSLTLFSGVGLKQGRANVIASLSTFGFDGFDSDQAGASVRLRRGDPPPESPPESPPIFGAITSTTGAVGGATVLALAATGMTLGFVRVVRRNERRDRDI
jgi:hypothetical protein